MNAFNILKPGPWFGPKLNLSEVPHNLNALNEEVKLLSICNCFKSGDFSVRPSLEQFILECSHAELKQQAIRLYCCVARHKDIGFIGKLLEKSDDDEILSIVLYASTTLSPEIVPYLFALLDTYLSTPLEQDILSSINRIFPFQYNDENIDIAELGARFSGFANSLIPDRYYYEGVAVFPGNLTKTLIETAANSRTNGVTFSLAIAPTLLSIWSGELCPVFYGEHVSDETFKETIEYVKCLAAMPWIKGGKYFYGYQLTD
jgi:Immunity protein 47